MHVIIFGPDGYNTLGVMRSLGNKKINIFLLLVSNKRINYTLYSRYLQEYKIVKDDQEGINYLLSNSSHSKITIIPTSDMAESALDIHYSLLKDKYIFPNAGENGIINKIMDKKIMSDYASEAGLNVPITIKFKKGDSIPANIIYPNLVKPEKSITGSKKDMAICYDKEDVQNTINNSKNTEDFLIQQYIKKDFDILLIGASLYNGDVIIPAVFKKERWYLPGDDGSMGLITTNVDKYISITEVEQFVHNLKYYGPFSIEFGVMDDIPYFYEINLRNDGTSHYFNKANINIPYLWLLDSYGIDIEEYSRFENNNYYFSDEFGDYLNIITNRLPIKEWYADLKKASVYKYFYKDDIKPFLLIMPKMILLSMYKILKLNYSKLKSKRKK